MLLFFILLCIFDIQSAASKNESVSDKSDFASSSSSSALNVADFCEWAEQPNINAILVADNTHTENPTLTYQVIKPNTNQPYLCNMWQIKDVPSLQRTESNVPIFSTVDFTQQSPHKKPLVLGQGLHKNLFYDSNQASAALYCGSVTYDNIADFDSSKGKKEIREIAKISLTVSEFYHYPPDIVPFLSTSSAVGFIPYFAVGRNGVAYIRRIKHHDPEKQYDAHCSFHFKPDLNKLPQDLFSKKDAPTSYITALTQLVLEDKTLFRKTNIRHKVPPEIVHQ